MVCLDCWDWCSSQSRAVQCIATLTHVPSHSLCVQWVKPKMSPMTSGCVHSLCEDVCLLVIHCHVGSLGCSLVRRIRGACCVRVRVRTCVCVRARVCVCSIVTMFVLFCSCRLLLSHLLTNCWDGGTVHCLPRALYRARIQTTRHTRIRTCTTLCPCLQWSFVQSPTPEPATWDPYLADRRQVVGDLSRRC